MATVRSAVDPYRPGSGQGTSLSAPERYHISQFLAEGGMSTIYLGKRFGVGGFEAEVALKQLLPEFASNPQLTELFVQEALLSAALDHPNIVHTQDLVQVGGSHYMVMEYVRGCDLQALLRRARQRQTRFSTQAALYIARELLDALRYVHGVSGVDGKPVIHRDVSPSNVLLSAQGEVKLSDFGIARAGGLRVRGKVGYMSPEQARGEEIDCRSDLFSLAAVIYEVLCGERLFIGEVGQSAVSVYGVQVVPPSRRCAALPQELDAVLLRALDLSPGGRFQSASEFYDALYRAARRLNLLIGHAEMAEQLREVCGPDPQEWRRPVDRTGTAMISADEQAAEADHSEEPHDESGQLAVEVIEEHEVHELESHIDHAPPTRIEPRLVLQPVPRLVPKSGPKLVKEEAAFLPADPDWTAEPIPEAPPLVPLPLAPMPPPIPHIDLLMDQQTPSEVQALELPAEQDRPVGAHPVERRSIASARGSAAERLRGRPATVRFGARAAPAPAAALRSDRTVPMERHSHAALGIADMARKMVYREGPKKLQPLRPLPPLPSHAHDHDNDHDTESVTRIRPGVTMQMAMLAAAEMPATPMESPPPAEVVDLRARLSWGRLGLVGLVIMVVVLAMLLGRWVL